METEHEPHYWVLRWSPRRRRLMSTAGIVVAASVLLTGCEWRGLNGLTLPGTAGGGDGSYSVQVQMAQVNGIEQNSRVRVNDVTVGNITDIEVDRWQALVTIRLAGDVELPGNAVAKIGQTSLLGTQHIELTPPPDKSPEGRLRQGDVIESDKTSAFPTTEQTLAALSLVLNGGGLGNIQDINRELGEALYGREDSVKSLLAELDTATANLVQQKQDIIYAMDGLNNLASEVGEQKDVLDRGLQEIPKALTVLNEQRDNISTALLSVGNLADQADQLAQASTQDVVDNLENLAPVFRALADNGRDLTRSLEILTTFPWAADGVQKFIRGDYANLSAVIDLTASRLDQSLLIGTSAEGSLTAFEQMLGRTVGLAPKVNTTNPLTSPVSGAGG